MRQSTISVVNKYIARNGLLMKTDKSLVALSGGADSVALLLILKELGYNVEAVHCNFRLRGEESDRDEDFVKRLCQARKIPLHLVHFNTKEYARLHKVSIEMAARNLRYHYFEQLRKDIAANAICVGHHREDSVETLLINLLRGTGVHGLTGIHPRNGRIVRPLLCIGRQDIEDYLQERNQPFVTDSTNLIDDVTRNKIRLNVMPVLREIAPHADKSIWATAQRIAEAAKIFDKAIEEATAQVAVANEEMVSIDIPRLLRQPSPEYLLYEILKNYGFTPQQVEDIHAHLQAQSGRIFTSDEYNLVFDRDSIVVERQSEPQRPLRLPEPGKYMLNEKAALTVSVIDTPQISKENHVATLDADKVRFPLSIRATQAGDRFVPFGMKGSKLVSDYLTDRKQNILQKRAQLVVCDRDDNIVWVVNERTDNRFRITPSTHHTLRMSYQLSMPAR